MSWISDIREELRNLDTSRTRLRKFGLMLGSVFFLLTLWMRSKNYVSAFLYPPGIIAILLMLFGIIYPQILKKIYKVWMGMAISIGWAVSKILLVLLYFSLITPIGSIARLFGKEFLDIKEGGNQASYWLKKDKKENINYEKMY